MCRGVQGQEEEDDVTGKEHELSGILMSLPMSAGDVWIDHVTPLCVVLQRLTPGGAVYE